MTDRDYLWCALNMALDDQEVLESLCPSCRTEAEERRCPVCGVMTAWEQGGENSGFDAQRFERLRQGVGT